MKGLKRLCISLSIMGTVLLSAILPSNLAFAKEKKPTSDDAKNGVVQVNIVFTDEAEQKHILCGGSGFIVGDPEETEYVITCNHIVSPSDEMKVAAFEFYQIPMEEDTLSRTNYEVEVVLEGDVVVSAAVMNSSAELDLAVLKLSQPIYTREPLTILTSKNYSTDSLPYATTERVYALGYPDIINYDSVVQYFSDQQVVMTAGSIVNLLNLNGVQVIESDINIGPNNCGGPIVNEYGYVIGMNLLTKDGMYSCSLDSTKIAKVLDGLGVTYSKVNKNPEEKEEKPATVVTEPVETIPTYIFIIIGVGAVLIVGLIVALIVIKVSHRADKEEKPKKEKKKKNKVEAQQNDALAKYVSKQDSEEVRKLGSIQENGSDTTILSGNIGVNETTILDAKNPISEQLKIGTLLRLKTGEKIVINKAYFTIGKDNLHVDYCMKDNRTISRQHVIFKQAKEGLYIEDNNSTNGTWLNGKKLVFGRAELVRNGDLIRISNEEFEYQA
ncbi:trypsin-like peptidase domain-containing protein [Pseudobutyrivibrio sp.]|jgi:Na+-transporting methylmalonyl-CoA/oxaloacetate decarboxylase gamma subunit|uniref:trypsin-like peptidase domain-containing protein n=1 Tax=Pseudobutyrivibrio sp. TaxID=2014367 RepID=UPI0025D05727|nr:trypsin-like peptidase domain-containing protein [Pseudobutyrivibrio sp.]